jgi:hypothetical protein
MFVEEKDYHLILVGNGQVGLIGLKEIFEELKNLRIKPESELKQLLLERASKKNYIPSSLKGDYEKAFFREFRKFLGEKVEEEKSGFLEVIILGPGCYSCNKLEQDVMAVLSETGIQASLNHVTDPTLMSQYGNPSNPAFIINGKVKSGGTIPMKSTIKKWLEEEKR